MERALLRLIFVVLGMSLSIATTIFAYGLHVESWGWLIAGTIGSIVVMALPDLLS